MKYQYFNYSDKLEVEKLLESPSEETRSSTIVGMVNGITDAQWVQNKLLELINDESFWVAKNAIMGFGDLARLHGKLDLLKVKSAFEKIDREELKEAVKDTLNDLTIFLK